MKMKKSIIPNLFTISNLVCGCIAMVSILYGWYGMAFLTFILGLFFDFSDGLVARALNVSSEMGKQLDSLADMVSFGVVPGTILFSLLSRGCYGDAWGEYFPYQALPGFLFTGFAAYRLGKFNLDERQSDVFHGLNTPASTVFVMGIMMAYHDDYLGLAKYLDYPWFLYAVTLLLGLAMIGDFKMFSFKAKNTKWKGNELRYSFVVSTIILLIFFQYLGLSLAVILYLLLSFIFINRN